MPATYTGSARCIRRCGGICATIRMTTSATAMLTSCAVMRSGEALPTTPRAASNSNTAEQHQRAVDRGDQPLRQRMRGCHPFMRV